MTDTGVTRDARPAIRYLAFAAVAGFIAGAFLISALVWNFGNIIGSRSENRLHPPGARTAMERWGTRPEIVIRPAEVDRHALEPLGDVSLPVPTAGTTPNLFDRTLELPVSGAKRDSLRSSFSDTRSGGRTHEAIDILAPRDTPVLAADDGVIAKLFYSRAGGITIYQFDPTHEYVYYYAHLERYAANLKEADPIKKGQVIGYVGTTGNAPANVPHLHFAIFRLKDTKNWWQGEPIDPYDVLK